MTNTVRLQYSRVDEAMHVDVLDVETNSLITHDTLGNVAEWLRCLGFKWRWGSNGIWER